MFGNKLSLQWIYDNADAQDLVSPFALNSAYYAFLFNGEVGMHVDSNYQDGIVNYYELHERAMIGQKTDGTIILAVTTVGKMTGEEQGQFLKSMGYSIGFNLDGGYSRNLICGNDTAISSSRNVLNAFVVVKRPTSPTPSVTVSGVNLFAKNTPFRVRTSPVSGTELVMVPISSYAKILQFVPGFQSDGYQWAYVEYNGIRGYSQLDTSSDYLIQKSATSSTIYLKASKLQFRIRSNPVNGTQLAMVPVNYQAKILSTENGFASDGYQWAYVEYNGIKGYSQMDLQNAYTLVE